MTLEEIRDINERLDRLTQSMAAVVGDVRVIRNMVETESQRCIYREKIDQAVALVPRVTKLEDRLVQLEIRVAAIGGLAGVIASVITAIIVHALA
jgi:hypothetical protein